MLVVIIVDLIVVIAMLRAASRGFEHALPVATFALILIPIECFIPLGLFTITPQRLIIGLLVLLYLTRKKPQSGAAGPLPLTALILIHIAWCIFTTTNSIVQAASLKKMASVVFEYYALYVLFFRSIISVTTIHRILVAMALAMILCSVWGTGEAYSQWDIYKYLPTSSHHFGEGSDDRADRIRSTFDHAILYGAALAMAITVVLYLSSVYRGSFQRLLLFAGLPLLFLNLYKTGSRGPWIDAILSCVLLFVLGHGRLKTIIATIGMVSLLVLVVRPGVRSTIVGIYENTFSADTSTGSSYAYRYALQTAAVKRLMQQPTTRAVWGYGLESFYDVHLEGPLLGEPHDFLSCDHAWVEILVETGFVGLGIMIVLLLTPALSVLRVLLRKGEEHRQLALMLFVNLVVFYFQMLSVGMYSWGQNGYMLWITIAITYSYLRMSSAGTITGVERVQQPEQADRNLIYGKQSWWDALETA